MKTSADLQRESGLTTDSWRFWLRVAAFAVLVVGGIDAALWFIPGGMLALAFTMWGSPVVFLASVALAFAFVLTVLMQAYWCGRMVLGWNRAHRGDIHTVVNFGSSGGRFAARGVALVNSVMAVAALVVTVGGEYLPVRSGMAFLLVISSAWVGVYMHAGRRWDGRRLGRWRSTVD